MRGAITKLALFGYVGAARFWDLTEYYIYTAYDYASWDDFGATLKIFFSTSSSAYTTGDALYSGTADASITFEDINDAHTARSLSPVVGAAAANNNYLFPRMLLSCNAAIEKVNDFSSDTIYVWFAITRPNYMPFLYSDPGTGIDSDFNCVASLLDPKLLVSKA